VQRNPFGFVMLLALALWVAYTVVRALRSGEVFSRGMYRYGRDEQPFMYWMVVTIHAGIVVYLVRTLATL
jgi:hypothetical protein